MDRAFLTGSRAYGTPSEDSDIDIAMLLSKEDLDALLKLCDGVDATSPNPYQSGWSLRFGKLNLLCFDSEPEFKGWMKATELLIERKPVTRQTAIFEIDNQIVICQQGGGA